LKESQNAKFSKNKVKSIADRSFRPFTLLPAARLTEPAGQQMQEIMTLQTDFI